MLLAPLSYTRPETVDEAVAALVEDPGARVLAGGQTLINVLKLRLAEVSRLVDVSRLPELQGMARTPDGVELGAALTYDELVASDDVREACPVLARVAAGTVDRQVRARGTLGGNVCLNDPSSNFPPLLVAAGATMHVRGPDGRRDVAAGDFFLGPFTTAVGPGEVLCAVTIPMQGRDEGHGYSSLQIAKDSWAIARASVWLRVDGTVCDARVVLGCTLPSPARQPAAEAALIGREPGDNLGDAAAELAGEHVNMVDDAHGSPRYRLRMSQVMVRDAVGRALEEVRHRAG